MVAGLAILSIVAASIAAASLWPMLGVVSVLVAPLLSSLAILLLVCLAPASRSRTREEFDDVTDAMVADLRATLDQVRRDEAADERLRRSA